MQSSQFIVVDCPIIWHVKNTSNGTVAHIVLVRMTVWHSCIRTAKSVFEIQQVF